MTIGISRRAFGRASLAGVTSFADEFEDYTIGSGTNMGTLYDLTTLAERPIIPGIVLACVW